MCPSETNQLPVTLCPTQPVLQDVFARTFRMDFSTSISEDVFAIPPLCKLALPMNPGFRMLQVERAPFKIWSLPGASGLGEELEDGVELYEDGGTLSCWHTFGSYGAFL